MKVWRIEGNVTVDLTMWVTGETSQDALDKLAEVGEGDLWKATSIKDIFPRAETAEVVSIRESTAENP